MAINTNHTTEDLNEVKCAVVEKNISKERAEYLKDILEVNKFTVVIAASAPPKAAKTAAPKADDAPVEEIAAPISQTEPASYTIGVTNLSFNSTNAIFGRLLKTRDGHIVTLAYWNQEGTVSHDEIPYYEKG
ncbi:MAG: hypothetical protein NTW54_07455 [Bacteroidetes bacterium]|nr:hypothetical protein [Bacteroidota bacterium]